MILLYRGTSWVSKCIRFFNWSKYSHVSWTFSEAENGYLQPDRREWESWTSNGVVSVEAIGRNHTNGTRVDLFDLERPLTMEESAALRAFLDSQVGKGYDWRGAFHFLTRSGSNNTERWFCSEYVFSGLQEAGREILENIPAYQVYPGMLSYSPEVRYVGYIIVGQGFKIHEDELTSGIIPLPLT